MNLLYKEEKHFLIELDGKQYEIFVDMKGRRIVFYDDKGEKLDVWL